MAIYIKENSNLGREKHLPETQTQRFVNESINEL